MGWFSRLPAKAKGPAMARAMTHPRTIVATGAIAAGAILGGLPALAVGGLAALAYGIASLFTVARPKELAKVVFPDIDLDLSRLDDAGSKQIQDALVARQSYRTALKDCPPGPFRDRFGDMSSQVDEVVEGIYKLVVRAQSLRAYLARTPERRKADELARAEANLRAARGTSSENAITGQVEALRGQLAARYRIQGAYDGAMAKISATIARVDQLAAQVTEVVLLSDAHAAEAVIPSAQDDVADLVSELDAVRQGLDEVGSTSGLLASPDAALSSPGGARQSIE